MAFLTDRKRAVGWGSAKKGTEHFWSMKVSSVALLVLIPLFIFNFGAVLGSGYDAILEHYSRPYPAVLTALTLLVGFKHFAEGFQVLIEDYVHGLAGKILIIGMTCLSYGAAAVGIFALAKMAL